MPTNYPLACLFGIALTIAYKLNHQLSCHRRNRIVAIGEFRVG